MIRRTVPNDNSCLFYAFAYCCEGAVTASRGVEQRLRRVVADAVLADPDPETRALFLGKAVQEYADWIMNPFHWGGEPEIVILSEYYKVETVVVNCETMSTSVYGQGPSATKGRIYVLYTGQHYDPLVAGASPDVSQSDEVKVQPLGDNTGLDASALSLAKQHVVDAARKAAQKRVKKIKCGGCGALLDNSAAFQEHCMDETVEHADDFAYDCSEVEVVYEQGDSLPEDAIDLTDEAKVVTFYNSKKYGFSNFFPAPVELESLVYPTGEHAWQSLKYVDTAPELAAKIQQAETVDAAHMISHSEGVDKHRRDWDSVKYDILLAIIRAKFRQHPPLLQELLATGDRLIVNVDTDQWAGMSAAGGIPTGQNNMGKALMQARKEFREAK